MDEGLNKALNVVIFFMCLLLLICIGSLAYSIITQKPEDVKHRTTGVPVVYEVEGRKYIVIRQGSSGVAICPADAR